MNSTPPSLECPICHKRLEDDIATFGGLVTQCYPQPTKRIRGWLACPTKVQIEEEDLIRSKTHYLVHDNTQELLYPPFTIIVSPEESERTDIWYRDSLPGIVYGAPNPRRILSLPKILDLPWDNEALVRDTIHFYLTFT